MKARREPLAIFLLLSAALAGCATVTVPNYIRDKNPYSHRYYASFDDAVAAVETTLAELGWVVERTVDPAMYEQWRDNDLHDAQILVLTEARQTALFLGTRYARMNVYVRNKDNISEIELRYVTVSSVPLRTWTSFRDDGAARRFFERVETRLKP